jgi:hypothetical protein
MVNPYLDLTAAFNQGRLRALISSGQAVVVHRLAIMSKDGDWVLREDVEATGHVLAVLAVRGARYRFGAPLDPRWLAGGWSAHLEHRAGDLRLRTDFVSRPPRVSKAQLDRLWQEAEAEGRDVVPLEPLTRLKMTRREKDYAVIGELARRLDDPRSELRYSRSSRDLIRLAEEHPDALSEVLPQRPVLARVAEGRDALEEALDHERRVLMREDEERLARYADASAPWRALWPEVAREIADRPLPEAHRIVIARAEGVLPFELETGDSG